MKKNWFLLVIGGVVLLAFIFGTSYAWYYFFKDDETVMANLEIKIDDGGKGVVIRDALPMSDEEGKKEEAYKFEVKNNGTGSGNYKLLIEETPFNQIDDGCTQETLLDRSQLRYQLLMNGKEIVLGDLDSIENNTLDFRTIGTNQRNTYELRVWVADDASNTQWQNKHYHYSITILPSTMEEIS